MNKLPEQVLSFDEFIKKSINEQELPPDMLGGDPGLPPEQSGMIGGMGGEQPAGPDLEITTMDIIFIKLVNGQSIYTNTTKNFIKYTESIDKIKEWAKGKISDSKIDTIEDIIYDSEKIDTIEEKQFLNKFKTDVIEGRLGINSGYSEVEFDEVGNAYADELDVTFVFYEDAK